MKILLLCLVAVATASPYSSSESRERGIYGAKDPDKYISDSSSSEEDIDVEGILEAWNDKEPVNLNIKMDYNSEKHLIDVKFGETSLGEDIDGREVVLEDDVEPKCSLDGVWYNDVGSELILRQTPDGHIEGEYRTAVETKPGYAGKSFSVVRGTASSTATAKTFGFSVVWNKGDSVTSWTGQCVVCDGKETLLATWILTGAIDKCEDNWQANRIGQNKFTREEQNPGPRKHENTHIPSDVAGKY